MIVWSGAPVTSAAVLLPRGVRWPRGGTAISTATGMGATRSRRRPAPLRPAMSRQRRL
jgi:hypothetical protein